MDTTCPLCGSSFELAELVLPVCRGMDLPSVPHRVEDRTTITRGVHFRCALKKATEDTALAGLAAGAIPKNSLGAVDLRAAGLSDRPEDWQEQPANLPDHECG